VPSQPPPLAERRPRKLEMHGDVREDDWYWLRDRDDPKVIEYLEAENAYTDAQTAHLAALREQLFQEFKARIQETDESPPVWWHGHWYSTRTVEGLEYEIHCRRTGSLDAPEDVLLDENELAAGKEFFELRALAVSPSHDLAAYGVNFDGTDFCDVRFRDLVKKRDLDDVIANTAGDVEWANDDRTVFYVQVDPALRPHQLWRYRLGDGDSHTLVYEEPDERYRVRIEKTKDEAFLVLSSVSSTTSEVRVLDADDPTGEFIVVEPRREGHRYFLEHHPDRGFLVTTNMDGAVNYELRVAPTDAPAARNWTVLVPHRDDVRLYGVEAFKDHLVLAERADAVRRLRVMQLDGGDTWDIDQPEEVSTAVPGDNPEFDTATLRYEYSSLVTPESVFDYDLRTRQRTLVKRQPVLGGFDSADYRTERQWATADDGTLVPMSLVYRADLSLTPDTPAVLYGYGSYEISIDPDFSPFVVSMLDRGVLYAFAHPRGGGEMGRRWYEDGKFLNKRNTFGDFVACADHLVKQGWTSPGRLVAMGGSAGGLLMGAVVNERPELWAGVLALVPFVDVVTTMLDETIPLTVPEFEEWGNPKDPEFYAYMKSYSPYDNVEAKDYPPMLVTTGINDTRVAYWEPAKWVARLRVTKTDGNPLLLKTELSAGHHGPSGRYGEWRERAFWYAWILDQLGLATPD
jgi:oligopeptidase B